LPRLTLDSEGEELAEYGGFIIEPLAEYGGFIIEPLGRVYIGVQGLDLE
jgi:hypothetical protein